MRTSPPVIIVTNCTNRKRAAGRVLKLSRRLVGEDLTATVDSWKQKLATSPGRISVDKLYAGRSVVEARRAAAAAPADLYFVSAGLGLVPSTAESPAYDLTASESEGGLPAVLGRFSVSAADWWMAVTRGHGVLSLLRSHSDAILLLALPADYVTLLAHDLASASGADTKRLRIFTSRPGRAALPGALIDAAIPYDGRLESIPKYDGTLVDFPQRALRHFVVELHGHRLSLEEGCSRVQTALAGRSVRQTPLRARVSDDQVRALLQENWVTCKGQSGRLLRYLRDESRIACEQARFGAIWREVRDERAAAKRAN